MPARRRERGHVGAEPLGQDPGAVEAQRGQRCGVPSAVVVAPVEADLSRQGLPDPVGRVGVALRGQPLGQTSRRIAQLHQGAVGVEEHRLHARPVPPGIRVAHAMIPLAVRRSEFAECV